jgi:undecaprenyl-diphosphatase
MVLIPILGENLLTVMKMMKSGFVAAGGTSTIALLIGFSAAFISGLLACKFMINLVKKGKLIYFAIYCVLIAIVAFML